jgi:hypothetical protein
MTVGELHLALQRDGDGCAHAPINWNRLSMAMSDSFVSARGRPASSARVIAGLL